LIENYAGWSIVEAFGIPVRVFGAQVYHHAGRDEYAIERDHECLMHPNATEASVLEHILKLQREHERMVGAAQKGGTR